MSNAFKCDGCGDLRTGTPEKRGITDYRGDIGDSPQIDSVDSYDFCANCAKEFDAHITEFLSGADEETLATDGGQDREDLIEEHGEEAVVELEDPFISGVDSYIHDRPDAEPELDFENACTECGEEAYHFRCPSCGRPLCSKHQELGAGFCSDYGGRDEGCQIDEEGDSA